MKVSWDHRRENVCPSKPSLLDRLSTTSLAAAAPASLLDRLGPAVPSPVTPTVEESSVITEASTATNVISSAPTAVAKSPIEPPTPASATAVAQAPPGPLAMSPVSNAAVDTFLASVSQSLKGSSPPETSTVVPEPVDPPPSRPQTSHAQSSRSAVIEECRRLLTPHVFDNARRRHPNADKETLRQRVRALLTEEWCEEMVGHAHKVMAEMRQLGTSGALNAGDADVGSKRPRADEEHRVPAREAKIRRLSQSSDVAAGQKSRREDEVTRRNRSPLAEGHSPAARNYRSTLNSAEFIMEGYLASSSARAQDTEKPSDTVALDVKSHNPPQHSTPRDSRPDGTVLEESPRSNTISNAPETGGKHSTIDLSRGCPTSDEEHQETEPTVKEAATVVLVRSAHKAIDKPPVKEPSEDTTSRSMDESGLSQVQKDPIPGIADHVPEVSDTGSHPPGLPVNEAEAALGHSPQPSAPEQPAAVDSGTTNELLPASSVTANVRAGSVPAASASIGSEQNEHPVKDTVMQDQDSSGPQASDPPPLDNMPVLWAMAVGSRSPRVIDVSFSVEDSVAQAVQRWARRQSDFNEKATYVSVHLLCLPIAVVVDAHRNLGPSAPPDVVATAFWNIPTKWPAKGTLLLETNPGQDNSHVFLPAQLGPTDGPLDVTAHVRPGVNSVRLIQLRDMSQYVFAIHAAVPRAEERGRFATMSAERRDWAVFLNKSSGRALRPLPDSVSVSAAAA